MVDWDIETKTNIAELKRNSGYIALCKEMREVFTELTAELQVVQGTAAVELLRRWQTFHWFLELLEKRPEFVQAELEEHFGTEKNYELLGTVPMVNYS
jgi:hypothetical protein